MLLLPRIHFPDSLLHFPGNNVVKLAYIYNIKFGWGRIMAQGGGGTFSNLEQPQHILINVQIKSLTLIQTCVTRAIGLPLMGE